VSLIVAVVLITAEQDLDRVIGVVRRRTVFDHIVRENCNRTLRELMRPALFVSEDRG